MNSPKLLSRRALVGLSAAAITGLAAPAALAAPVAPPGFTVTTFAGVPGGSPAIKGPDDVASLKGHVFVGWQNGVGPKGEPSPTGQTSGTVIEYSRTGRQLQSWTLSGKVDGLGGDPEHRRLIVTVNEDGNSSLYTITPRAPAGRQVRHYRYAPAPDSGTSGGVLTGGGTDAVSVRDGHIYLSASNPTPPHATAVFQARLNPRTGVATLSATFADNATATDAVTGQTVTLGLTDPDSNALVPEQSPRFGGDFVLAAQGDQQLVFAHELGRDATQLTRLSLTHAGASAGVDDVRWTTSHNGTLIVVDNAANAVYAVNGPFRAGQPFASLDNVGGAPQNNEVDSIDLGTGALNPFLTGLGKAKGLLWLPSNCGDGGGGGDSGVRSSAQSR